MKNLWRSIVNYFWIPVETVATTSTDTVPVKPKRVKKPKVEATPPETVAPTVTKKPRKRKVVEGNASLLGDAK